eukprot:XP_027304706.1 uncharacterized protein LOC113842230 [Anas platyrhynchos]
MFSPDEWQHVGDCLWDKSISSGKLDKGVSGTWHTVINELCDMKTKQQLAMAAVQALSVPSGTDRPPSTKPETSGMQLTRSFSSVPAPTPVRGMTFPINQSVAEITEGLSKQSADGEWGLPSPPPAPENLDKAVLPASVPLSGSNKSTQYALAMRGAAAACENRPSEEELFQELLVKFENLKIKDSEELPLSSAPPKPTPSLSIATTLSAPRRDRCSDVIRDAIIEGHWHATSLACPIIIDPVQGSGLWQPHDCKLLQARKTVTDYGLQSQAARQIIQWIFQAELMCPLDCQNLARLLLTPSQLLLFEREWLQLPQGEAGRLRQPGDPLYGITAEMLKGTGPYLNTQIQLQFL